MPNDCIQIKFFQFIQNSMQTCRHTILQPAQGISHLNINKFSKKNVYAFGGPQRNISFMSCNHHCRHLQCNHHLGIGHLARQCFQTFCKKKNWNTGGLCFPFVSLPKLTNECAWLPTRYQHIISYSKFCKLLVDFSVCEKNKSKCSC